MFDFHVEQIDHEDLVVECDYDFILTNADHFYYWLKTQICNNSLSFFSCINYCLLSSKIASRFGCVNGVYFCPTNPIKLLLLIIYTICKGDPKSRSCFKAKGWVLYILNPLEVASATKVLSGLKLTELIVYVKLELLSIWTLTNYYSYK
jgi:hypothetical protein